MKGVFVARGEDKVAAACAGANGVNAAGVAAGENATSPETAGASAACRVSGVPVLTVTGFSNSGKTTFLTEVVALLSAEGLRVGVVKNHGHAPGGVDQEGKDSWKYAQAGANPVVLSASAQYAVFTSTPDAPATRDELVARIADDVDLVVVEGFRSAAEGAVEVSRKATGKGPKLAAEERIALVSDDEDLRAQVAAEGKPVFDMDDFAGFARWLRAWARV